MKDKRNGPFTGSQLDRIEDALAVISAGLIQRAQLAEEMKGYITARALNYEGGPYSSYFQGWLIRLQATESLDGLFPPSRDTGSEEGKG